MIKQELMTIYDSQKSFYKKAYVITNYEDNKTIIELLSYSTIVASIIIDGAQTIYKYNGYYSKTTARHQKEFFKQNGLNDEQYTRLKKQQELIINE